MATVYHRDQPGAPALVYSTGLTALTQFTALKTVLKACLVNGFGSQPAAGWALINEGANFIVLRSGSQSGYVCLTYIPSQAVHVYLAETYTGMSGDVMTGAGLVSGNAANSSPPHKLNIYTFATQSASSTWALIADSKTFIMTNADYTSGVNHPLSEVQSPQSPYMQRTLYVGEDTNGRFIACGGSVTAAVASIIISTFNASGFTALKNPGTGLFVTPAALTVQTPGLRTISTSDYSVTPAPITKVELARIPWCGGGVYGGDFRGLAITPALQEYPMPGYAAKTLGYADMLTYRSANTPIDLGDGHTYFARLTAYTLPFFLVTDNPEFW